MNTDAFAWPSQLINEVNLSLHKRLCLVFNKRWRTTVLFFATMVGRTSLPDSDVIVLGAGMAGSLLGFGGMVIELMRTLGMYGIHAARTYLDIHPWSPLGHSGIGLCRWGDLELKYPAYLARAIKLELIQELERTYDTFWTQTLVGFAKFSDQPMTTPPMEDQYFGYFPAKCATNFIESYVDNHIYKDKTIRDRIMFNIRVQQVEPLSGSP